MHRPEWDGARLTGGLTDAGLFATRNRLLAELAWLVDTPPRLVAAQRFANHLATEFTALLTFLWDPAVDATNWRAEQAIRPAVVTRKVCGGNRTRRGADTQQVLASVVRTAKQSKRILSRFDPSKRHGAIVPAWRDTMAAFCVESRVAPR